MDGGENKKFWKEYALHGGVLTAGVFASLFSGIFLQRGIELAKTFEPCANVQNNVAQMICASKIYLEAAQGSDFAWVPAVFGLSLLLNAYAAMQMFDASFEHFSKNN